MNQRVKNLIEAIDNSDLIKNLEVETTPFYYSFHPCQRGGIIRLIFDIPYIDYEIIEGLQKVVRIDDITYDERIKSLVMEVE